MPLRPLVLPGVLILAWLLFSTPHGLTGLDILAGLAAAGAGVLASVLWPKVGQRAERTLAAAEDLLGEGDRRLPVAVPEEDPEGDPDAVDDRAAPAAMETLLGRLADSMGATRLVLWRVDREADEIAAEHAVGPLPVALSAAGNPLAWALDQRSPVRLDPAPRWARGAAVVAPVDQARVLTVETAVGEPSPDADDLRHAADVLAPFLRLHDQQAHAAAATRRLDRVVGYLRSVPREQEPTRMAVALAGTAMEIVGGTGALVASWSATDHLGRVLVTEGAGGGPRRGSEFGAMDGDLAHAARTAATVRRAPGDRWPELGSADDRWERPPPAYRTVVPLVDPRGEPTGLLAVWGRTPPATHGITLLQAIAPLLALQLRHAGDLAHFRERATIDALTGLPNRAAFQDRMSEEAARFQRYRRPTALLVVDLDHFKRINDIHGHEAGDAVLRRVAEVLRAALRHVDFPGRFGGEELVVLLPETMLRAALDVAERVRHAVESAGVEFEGRRIPVTASIGVSACPECVEEPDALFATADQALYASKEGGRNRVTAAARLAEV